MLRFGAHGWGFSIVHSVTRSPTEQPSACSIRRGRWVLSEHAEHYENAIVAPFKQLHGVADRTYQAIGSCGAVEFVEVPQGWLHVSSGKAERWKNWGIVSFVAQMVAILTGFPFLCAVGGCKSVFVQIFPASPGYSCPHPSALQSIF
jgi:hypothetical protein